MDEKKTVTAMAFVSGGARDRYWLVASIPSLDRSAINYGFPFISGPCRSSRDEALADMAMITEAFESMLRSMGYQDVKWEVE